MRNGKYELVLASPCYPGFRYRGKYCYAHHLTWWLVCGVCVQSSGIDELVHHLDEDTRNNSPDNLVRIGRSEHSSSHASERQPVAMVELDCPVCGKLFVRTRRGSFLAKSDGKYTPCSPECFRSAAGHTRLDMPGHNHVRVFMVEGTRANLFEGDPMPMECLSRYRPRFLRGMSFPARRQTRLVKEVARGEKTERAHTREPKPEKIARVERIPLSRNELATKVWEAPVTTLAKQLGVSDVAIHKRCKRLGIETPPRGYWRKLETSKMGT